MLSDVQFFIFFTALFFAVYWILPPSFVRARRWTIAIASMVIIYVVSPLALLVGLLFCLIAYLIARFEPLPSSKLNLRYGVILMILVWVGVQFLQMHLNELLKTYHIGILKNHPFILFNLGTSFLLFKSISLLNDEIKGKAKVGPRPFSEFLVVNLFYPSFSAGPMEMRSAFSDKELGKSFDIQFILDALARTAVGLFKILYLGDQLCKWALDSYFQNAYSSDVELGFFMGTLFIFVKLFYLYFNFSGYSDIAIACGRGIGITIRENFKLPFLAVDLQDFWRRWHISMSDFVYRYILFPLASALGGRLNLATFLIFCFLGIWHQFTLPFLCWGLLHGIGLVYVANFTKLGRNWSWYQKVKGRFAWRLVCRALTLYYVALTWAIADSGALDNSINFLGNYLG